jgi:hypothetical protein
MSTRDTAAAHDSKRARTEAGRAAVDAVDATDKDASPPPAPPPASLKPTSDQLVQQAAPVAVSLHPSCKYLSTDGGEIRALVSVDCTPENAAAAKLHGTLDTLLVLDRSASMASVRGGALTGEKAIQAALESLSGLVDETHVKHSIALAWFGTDAGQYAEGEAAGYTPWMPLAKAEVALRNLALYFQADKGKTNVEAALGVVGEMITERFHCRDREAAMTNVLFITDGDATAGDTNIRPLVERLLATAPNPVVVSTVAVGTGVGWTTVDDLVSPSHGYFGYAPTTDELTEQLTGAFEPYKHSCKPFSVLVEDDRECEPAARVHALGVLHPGNSRAVVRLVVKEKPLTGLHNTARVGLRFQTAAPATTLMLQYVDPDEMPDDNQPAPELRDYEAAHKFLQEMADAADSLSAADAAQRCRKEYDCAVARGDIRAWALRQAEAIVKDLEGRADFDSQFHDPSGGTNCYDANASTMIAMCAISRSQSAY